MSQVSLKVFGKNNKQLGGGAAQLRYIKEHGGWDEYHRYLFHLAADRFCDDFLEYQKYPPLKIVK